MSNMVEKVVLWATGMEVVQSGQQSCTYRLVDLPEIRDLARQITRSLAERHALDWFGQVCGRCGISCQRPDVLVREHEVFALQMRLGLTEKKFRKKYLREADTWNAGDAYLKNPGNRCPFLEGQPGTPMGTACSLHEVRPQSCRDYLANQPGCRKDPGLLVEEIRRIDIDATTTRVSLKNDTAHEEATDPQVWQQLSDKLGTGSRLPNHRLSSILGSIKDIVEERILDFHPSKVDDAYQRVFERVQKMLQQAAELVDMGDEQAESLLDESWTRLATWQEQIHGPRQLPDQPGESLSAERAWQALRLEERCLQVQFPNGQQQALERGTVLPAIQQFLEALLSVNDDLVQQALTIEEPDCYMCGECCRAYAVEIHPSDIQRLAHFLGLTSRQVVERYTLESRFSWNGGDRILQKKPVPTYSKNLRELRLLGNRGSEQCVFLERRQDGLFYCKVHSHKPSVCRAYQPTHALCRTTNQRENAGRQAQQLAWVELRNDRLKLHTRRRLDQGLEPLDFLRSEWPSLHEAASQLEHSVAQHLQPCSPG